MKSRSLEALASPVTHDKILRLQGKLDAFPEVERAKRGWEKMVSRVPGVIASMGYAGAVASGIATIVATVFQPHEEKGII
jgi:hypothetical protein